MLENESQETGWGCRLVVRSLPPGRPLHPQLYSLYTQRAVRAGKLDVRYGVIRFKLQGRGQTELGENLIDTFYAIHNLLILKTL